MLRSRIVLAAFTLALSMLGLITLSVPAAAEPKVVSVLPDNIYPGETLTLAGTDLKADAGDG